MCMRCNIPAPVPSDPSDPPDPPDPLDGAANALLEAAPSSCFVAPKVVGTVCVVVVLPFVSVTTTAGPLTGVGKVVAVEVGLTISTALLVVLVPSRLSS